MSDYQKMDSEVPEASVRGDNAKTMATIVYALQAASLFVGLTFLVGLVLAHVKRSDAVGTIYESHFRWQIRTFWFSLLWSVVGVITSFILIGYFVLLANIIWFIYRFIKGWIKLADGDQMYVK